MGFCNKSNLIANIQESIIKIQEYYGLGEYAHYVHLSIPTKVGIQMTLDGFWFVIRRTSKNLPIFNYHNAPTPDLFPSGEEDFYISEGLNAPLGLPLKEKGFYINN